MTTTVRNTELNPFEKKPKGKTPDEVQEVELGDKAIERILGVYQGLDFPVCKVGETAEIIRDLQLEILTPGQITLLLQKALSITSTERINHYVTGIFLSALIQYSYSDGYNGFVLNTQDTHIDRMGYRLEGQKENPLEIDIRGNVGSYFGHRLDHSKIKIEGDVGDWCGSDSKKSIYTMQGEVGDWCGIHSKDSIFQSSNRKTQKKLNKDVPDNIGWFGLYYDNLNK